MHASPSSSDVVSAWGRVVRCLLGHRADTADLLKQVLDQEPGWVPALCLRGFALLFKGRRAYRAQALRHAAEARAYAKEAPDQALVLALAAWANDDAWGAEAALQRRLALVPHDLFTVKLQHGLLFMMGQSQAMRDRIEAHVASWPKGDPMRGYVLGATVFARVECGDPGAAEAAWSEWNEQPSDDVWGLHAVAHLHHEQGRYGDALEWLDARRDWWRPCDRLGHHMDWHRALLHLKLGGPATALELYDTHLRGVFDGDYRDMSNAVSILWRLEALGIDVGPRWQELAAVCASLLEDHGSVFADAHYVLAQLHGGSPEAVEQLLGSMRTVDGSGYQDTLVRDLGVDLCAAIARWSEAPAEALAALRQIDDRVPLIGGSHAQRSLFEDLRDHLAG